MIDLAPLIREQVAVAMLHFDRQVEDEPDANVREMLHQARPRIEAIVRRATALELAKAIEEIMPLDMQ
jgi:hypothetical protein